MKLGHQPELYPTDEGRILGTEEFVDATIHHIGEAGELYAKEERVKVNIQFSAEALIEVGGEDLSDIQSAILRASKTRRPRH